MAHVRTKDPFGFVGAHVVFSGSQRQASSGGGPASGGAALFGDTPPAHAWVTRYDARLDCYSLFAPGRRVVSVLSRGDMMKLVADPSFEVRRGDDPAHASDGDDYPPPVEDTTSRYVGVPLLKAGAAAVKGSVTCFLPFADAYRADFDDGSSDEVSEDAIIESMIRMLTTPPAVGTVGTAVGTTTAKATATATATAAAAANREENTRKRKRTLAAAIASPVSLPPPATVRSVSAPVVSVTVPPPSMMPVSYAAVLGMDSSPVVTHSNILELAAARNRSSGVGGAGSTGFTPVAQTDRPAVAAPPPPRRPAPLPSPMPLTPTPFVKSEPSASSKDATNIIMLIDDEPDVEMIPLDVDEEVQVPVVTAVSGNDPWATSASTHPQPFYLITKAEHQQVAPLETRNLAYKYVRDELLNLLDAPEAGAKKLPIQYDILRNPDMKHISSIKRFTEASGLVVLNHLLTTYLAEETRDADVLLLLKIVAMLPIPARKHVADSKIALTIGKLTKPRSLKMYSHLPLCVTQLAKWIKRKWTKHFSMLEDQEKDVNRLRGTSPAAKSGHPSQRLATRTPSSGNSGGQRGRAETSDRLVDTTPIPRLASRPVLSNPTDAGSARPTTDVMGNPIAARASVSLPLSSSGAASGRRSSLKPDWLRQQETLRRTRFTSEGSQDSAAEFNHYKRVRESSASSADGAQSSGGSDSRQVFGTNAGASHSAPDNEQLESAGGVRGAYGRKQKLSFGSRWNIVEFLRDAPPNSIRPAAGGSRAASYHQPQRQHGRPRSILRRVSRYQGSLNSIR